MTMLRPAVTLTKNRYFGQSDWHYQGLVYFVNVMPGDYSSPGFTRSMPYSANI
jgi:hypothetical protein